MSGPEKQPKAGCDWGMINKREIDMGWAGPDPKGIMAQSWVFGFFAI